MFENIPLVEAVDSFPTIKNIRAHLLIGKYDRVPAMANKLFDTIQAKTSYELPNYKIIPTLSAKADQFLQLAYYICLSYIHLGHNEHILSVFEHIEYMSSDDYFISDPSVDSTDTTDSPLWRSFCICVTNNIPDLLFIKALIQFTGHKRLSYLLTLERLFSIALLTSHAFSCRSLISSILARNGLLEDSYEYLNATHPPDSLELRKQSELIVLGKILGKDVKYHYDRALELSPSQSIKSYIKYLAGNVDIDEVKNVLVKSVEDADPFCCTLLSAYISMCITNGVEISGLTEKLTYKIIKQNCFDASQMLYFRDLCWSMNANLPKNFINRLPSEAFKQDLL